MSKKIFFCKEIGDHQIFLRQMGLNNIKEKKIRNSSVAVVGAGALGSYVILGLIKMGIKQIRISDPDSVEPSNLNRQLYTPSDAGYVHKRKSWGKKGKNKAIAIGEGLKKYMATEMSIICFPEPFEFVKDFIKDIDCLIVLPDSDMTRLNASRLTRKYNISAIFGGVSRDANVAEVFFQYPEKYACWHCIHPNLEDNLSCERIENPSIVYPHLVASGLILNIYSKWRSGVSFDQLVRIDMRRNIIEAEHFIEVDEDCDSCGVKR